MKGPKPVCKSLPRTGLMRYRSTTHAAKTAEPASNLILSLSSPSFPFSVHTRHVHSCFVLFLLALWLYGHFYGHFFLHKHTPNNKNKTKAGEATMMASASCTALTSPECSSPPCQSAEQTRGTLRRSARRLPPGGDLPRSRLRAPRERQRWRRGRS